MSLTTAQAFAAFLTDITATENQKTSFIPSRKKSVDDDLTEGFPATSDMPYWKGILMGSARKNTIIRPLDDIDVLAVFSNENDAWSKYRYDSKAFLYRVREVYNGFKTQQVGARGQAVRVFYKNGGHVDVAPVFLQSDDVYSLPAGDGTWISTAPTKANDWYLKKNESLGYNLSPLVRLLKAWNRSHSKRLRSFHLETMAANVFGSLGTNYRDALYKFFQWAPNNLNQSDPGGVGGVGGIISGYITWTARTEILNSFTAAANRAGQALNAEARGDHEEAKRLWKIILGDNFPTS